MKSVVSTSLSRKLKSGVLWGLGFFAAFGLAFYAYAIGFPDTQPGPASGVVGMFVGATPQVYTGNISNYDKANGNCIDAYEDSHICTTTEIINTYNHNSATLLGQTDSFWVNGGSPANLEDFSSDCLGWSTDLSVAFGYVWDTGDQRAYLTSCDQQRAFACCK